MEKIDLDRITQLYMTNSDQVTFKEESQTTVYILHINNKIIEVRDKGFDWANIQIYQKKFIFKKKICTICDQSPGGKSIVEPGDFSRLLTELRNIRKNKLDANFDTKEINQIIDSI